MTDEANKSNDIDTRIYVFFAKLERQLELLNGKSETSAMWERIRKSVLDEVKVLLIAKRNTEKSVDCKNNRSSILSKITSYSSLISTLCINSIFFNPFLTTKKPTYIFFLNSRRVLGDDHCFHDIYTESFMQELPQNQTMGIEEPWNFKHFRPTPKVSLKYGDFLLFCSYVFGALNARFLHSRTKKILDTMEIEISREFGVSPQIRRKALNTLAKRMGVLITYRLLFKWLKPKIIFYVSLNTDLAVIEAAHLENISIIELQHGVSGLFSKYNDNQTIRSEPNYYFTFGKYWSDSSGMTIDRKNIIPIGFPFLESGRQKYLGTKKLDQVIFISHGSKSLATSAILMARSSKRPRHILFKLKPSEFNNWKTYYPELFLATSQKLLTVIDSDIYQNYHLLAESTFQVGVSSMLLFEGLAFGCRTTILKTIDSQYSSFLVDSKLAIYAETDSLIDLTKAPEIASNINYLFNSQWQSAFRNALEAIHGNVAHL